ncbi:MAG: fimbrillin family protein [Dysgonomonas sp.]|nr:fimbrillin family protein [Dysgonomonas sp.]
MKTQFSISTIFILCLGFISCSNEDDLGSNPDPNPNPKEELMEVELSVSKTQLRLFELTQISITDSRQYSYYDSIVWSIPDVFKDASTINSSLLSFGQSFYLPGEYKVSLSGYKDGKVASSDTVNISVENTGDFLGLRWNELTAYEPFNFLKRTSQRDIIHSIHMDIINDPVQFIKLRSYPNYSNEENWALFHKNSREEYYNYITSLYRDALFTFSGNDISKSDLSEEYNKRFTVSLEEIESNSIYIPVAIWETPFTYISLVGSIKSGIETDINYFRVVAQPRIR